ncbi:ROK family transcriptional regulator [Actinoplanes sp. NPDC051851]|uniref:ROK family transcriptional regulator n=1 Tax=Actinoplanes sp. NPDC051851 TaxID=3154753 RepID=UPI003433F16D
MTRPAYRVAPSIDTPIRQDSLRAHNLILTFRQIVGARHAPISRSELAVATGLTRPTISRIVDELLAAGLIVEAGPARSGSSGRPRVGLNLARTGPAGLGLDLRADSLSACVVDLTGTVRRLVFRPLPCFDPPSVLDGLATMASEAVAAAAAENLTVVGATVAVPGPVRGGVAQFAPVLGWRSVDISGFFSKNVDKIPVTVENDARLAALAELYAGSPDLRNFVCVSGEFDIGTGIVRDGVPLPGIPGHLGHVTVDRAGPPCPCGSTGCLQGLAGLRSLLAATSSASVAPAVTLDSLASDGDPAVLTALDQAATALGVALANLVNLVGTDTVLLGGSYSLLASWLTEGVSRELSARVLTAAWSPIEVRPAPLGPDAAVIGAALSAVDTIRRDPNRWLARA